MKRTTIFLSLVIWLTGATILLLKAGQLLMEALELSGSPIWPSIALVIGIVLGLIKTKIVFIPFCIKNLDRIKKRDAVMPWNAFSGKFWIMLILMMVTGATLSRLAHGNLIFLCIVAAVDLMVGIGLALSSKTFIPKPAD